MPELAIGCSGFNYNHWRGTFYPEKLPQRKWLEYYSGIFSTVELNVTFYRLPKPETFQKWYRETPPPFTFSIKGSRFITHIKRLVEPDEAVRRYFDAALNLEDKLKVVLWQLSPQFPLNFERLRYFLQLVSGYPVRHTLEFRHGSWLVPEVVDLCGKHSVAICMADAPEFIVETPVTANFVYMRRHGHSSSNTGCYTEEELLRDAERIRGQLAMGRDVYVYFNNDVGGFAPRNAQQLIAMLM